MSSLAIIPARMGATRLPGKPMREIHGMPMIGHVYLRTTLSDQFEDIYVATCDQEIFDYVKSIGGNVVMTSDQHLNCIDRTVEAVDKVETETSKKYDIIGMIQGDEPMNDPEVYTLAINQMLEDTDLPVVNIMVKVTDVEEFNNPSVVKVVCDQNSNAMYMSREPIPSKKLAANDDMTKQTGMIFFRKEYLMQFADMPKGRFELLERVDMLRVIERGDKVRMLLAPGVSPSVDTPEDLDEVVKLFNEDKYLKEYINKGS